MCGYSVAETLEYYLLFLAQVFDHVQTELSKLFSTSYRELATQWHDYLEKDGVRQNLYKAVVASVNNMWAPQARLDNHSKMVSTVVRPTYGSLYLLVVVRTLRKKLEPRLRSFPLLWIGVQLAIHLFLRAKSK